jgi:hypothetical protein
MKVSFSVIRSFTGADEYFFYWINKMIATYAPGNCGKIDSAELLNRTCHVTSKNYNKNHNRFFKKLFQKNNYYSFSMDADTRRGQVKINSDQTILQVAQRRPLERDYIKIDNSALESVHLFKYHIALHALCLYHFWSITRLSKLLHVSRGTLQKWTAGMNKIPVYRAVKENLTYNEAAYINEQNKDLNYFIRPNGHGLYDIMKQAGVHIDRPENFRAYHGRAIEKERYPAPIMAIDQGRNFFAPKGYNNTFSAGLIINNDGGHHE